MKKKAEARTIHHVKPRERLSAPSQQGVGQDPVDAQCTTADPTDMKARATAPVSPIETLPTPGKQGTGQGIVGAQWDTAHPSDTEARTTGKLEPSGHLSAPPEQGAGHSRGDPHEASARPRDEEAPANTAVTTEARLPAPDDGGRDQHLIEAQLPHVPPALINSIREHQAQRVGIIKAQIRLWNGCGAQVRRALGWQVSLPEKEQNRIKRLAAKFVSTMKKGDTPPPGTESLLSKGFGAYVAAIAESSGPLDTYRRQLEKSMDKMAATLPAAQWVQSVRGAGLIGLAIIVGEAGDLSNYANPGKLWKRLGLAVMGGKSQRKSRDKEEAERQGFNPRRRSAIWTIADSLMKGNKNGEGPGVYRQMYLDRKVYEREREAAWQVEKPMSDGHVHLRAQRYMEKAFIRDLWRAWRRTNE